MRLLRYYLVTLSLVWLSLLLLFTFERPRPFSSVLILYVESDAQTHHIYQITADGSLKRHILTLEDYPTFAGMSPDGSWLLLELFVAGNHDIYRLDLVTPTLQRLTDHPNRDYSAQLSPDGQWVAFVSFRTNSSNIYRMRVDGSDLQPLTNGRGSNIYPFWTNDGQHIVFISHNIDRIYYQMNGDGSNLTPLHEEQPVHISDRGWFGSDGKIFVFAGETAENDGGNINLYQLRADSGEFLQLTDMPGSEMRPRWSPDGEWIVFNSFVRADRQLDLYRMRLDGTQLTALTSGPASESMPQWSPDGEWIFYQSNAHRNADIYRMRADGTDVQRLTTSEHDDTSPIVRPFAEKSLNKWWIVGMSVGILTGIAGLSLFGRKTRA